MNSADLTTPAATDLWVPALHRRLFPEPPPDKALNTFAVLDGASIPDLLDHLYVPGRRPEFVCLYRGDLAPDIAEVAPYLVRLEPDSPFTPWLLAEGWGRHWGIFALSSADLNAARRHFRRFLMVKDPEGAQIYFRFYDPRVLPVFLPTCTASELRFLFGPVTAYFCEGESPSLGLRLRLDGDKLRVNALGLNRNGE